MYISRVSWLVAALLVASTVNEAAGQVRPRQRGDRRHAGQRLQPGAGDVSDRPLRRVHVVRVEPGAGRHQRRRATCSCATGTPTPTASSTRRAPSRRSASASSGPVQANGPSDDPVDHAGRTLRRLRVVRPPTSTAPGSRRCRAPMILRWDRLTGDIVLVSQNDGRRAAARGRARSTPTSRRRQPGRVTSWRQPADANRARLPAASSIRRDIAAGTLDRGSAVGTAGPIDRADACRRSRRRPRPSPTASSCRRVPAGGSHRRPGRRAARTASRRVPPARSGRCRATARFSSGHRAHGRQRRPRRSASTWRSGERRRGRDQPVQRGRRFRRCRRRAAILQGSTAFFVDFVYGRGRPASARTGSSRSTRRTSGWSTTEPTLSPQRRSTWSVRDACRHLLRQRRRRPQRPLGRAVRPEPVRRQPATTDRTAIRTTTA